VIGAAADGIGSATSQYLVTGHVDAGLVLIAAGIGGTASAGMFKIQSSLTAVRDIPGPTGTGVANATEEAGAAFHYTSQEWVQSIEKGGLRTGTYATPSGELSPLQAQLELSLPPNRGLPTARIEIDVAGLREAGYEIPEITRVSNVVRAADGRVYSMPGGGYEMQFPYRIPPQYIKVAG